MTDIQQKALALVDEVRSEYPLVADFHAASIALCRAIEQHEAFRQEVSDALIDYFGEHLVAEDGGDTLASFIIPAPKPDPLVEVVHKMGWDKDTAADLRTALEVYGLEIREKNDD